MIQESLMNFKDSIAKSGEMQLDFLLCQMLHRTPAEIQELEVEGKLTYEQVLAIAKDLRNQVEIIERL